MKFKTLFLSAALASTLVAQSSPQPATPATGEQIEVRVIEVDAVVTDRDGHLVPGLKRDDFEIRENGDAQPISNFQEIRATQPNDVASATHASSGTAQSEELLTVAPPRQIVIFFDHVRLPKSQADRFFHSVDEFMTKLRPQDEVMIATWEAQRFNLTVPFTRERAAISEELNRLYRSALLFRDSVEETTNKSEAQMAQDEYARSLAAERARKASGVRIPPNTTDPKADLDMSLRGVSDRRWITIRSKMTALDSLMKRLGRQETKKYMLLFSQQLPINLDANGIAGEFSTFGMMKMLTRTANSHGFTLYTFHPADVSAEIENLRNEDPEMDIAEATSQAIQRVDQETQSLRIVAHETGGTEGTGVTPITEQLQQITAALDSYYSLGYRATGAPRTRKIRVVVKNHPDFVVRSRDSFVERNAKEEFRDKAFANLFEQIDSTFPIALYAGKTKVLNASRRSLPLQVRIPYSALTLLPSQGKRRGGFSVFVLAGKPNGDLSKMIERTQSLELSDRDAEAAKSQYLTYQLEVEMGMPQQQLSIVVVDDVTKQAGYLRWTEPAVANAANRPAQKSVPQMLPTPSEQEINARP